VPARIVLSVALAFLFVSDPLSGRAAGRMRPMSVSVAPATDGGMDWLQFRLNERNDARVRGNLEVSWKVQTDGGFSSSPTIHDGHIFIGNNTGGFFVLNEQTGAVDWTRHFTSSIMAAPIVYHGTVYLGIGDQMAYRMTKKSPLVVGQGTNAIVAVDAASGKSRWSVPLGGTGMPTSAIVAGVLVHHDGAGGLVGIDPATGTLRFTRDLGGIASMNAILPVGDDRFVTNGYQKNAVWEIHSHDGSVVWEHDIDANDSGVGDCPPVTDGTRVYCDYIAPAAGLNHVDVGNPAETHAYGLALRDGSTAWDVPLETGPVPQWNEAAIPLISRGVVYVGNALAPFMHALDAVDGHLVWRAQVRGPVKGGVVCDERAIYFGDLAGYLWALDKTDGHVIGVKNMHTSFNVGSPVLDGRTLIVGTLNGEIFAVPVEQIRSSHDP
jgi:outer membrane protein assembly factor BamB